MQQHFPRRTFIKQATLGVAGLALSKYSFAFDAASAGKNDLYSLAYSLMVDWADALLKLQVTDQTRALDYGGIWCSADQAVHGRVGDTIYPFYYLAERTQNHKYIDAATLLYRWMESRVSQPDGSWLNEPVAGSWKGTTVFAAIALAEAVKNHGAIMDSTFKSAVTDRLLKAGNYVYDNFTIDYGNINYPVTGAYGLSLLGTLLDVPKFKAKGRELAHQALKCFTPKNRLLYGEGDITTPSYKGCYAVDLGYNVEESLPSLVMYGLLNNDQEVLEMVKASMLSHLEFMLPDGGWDNSWGTRNYKWTYWGSRTSDGSQTAYALIAHHDPRFYKAALQNTLLMRGCTHDGLLTGGLHYNAHHVPVCVHHTFSHIKALTTMLDYADQRTIPAIKNISLPREALYGLRFIADLQTWLIAKGRFRATVTGYDKEYKKTKNGHATGGALTMLWHELTGPLLCAGMNEYQIFEAGNQQPDADPHSMALTPRIELREGGKLYMNISDLTAKIETTQNPHEVVIKTTAKLVDKDQQSPPSGELTCHVVYRFSPGEITLSYECEKIPPGVKIIIPLISKSNETISHITAQNYIIKKEKASVKITSSETLKVLPTSNGRVFNYVPGFEAIPFYIDGGKARISISVI